MATATRTDWQPAIIAQLEQLTGDDIAHKTHAVVHHNGDTHELLDTTENENAAIISAEDHSTRFDGEVTVIALDDLHAYIATHPDWMKAVDEASPAETTDQEDDDTDEEATDDAELEVEGTASGPDPDKGRLFDVPRVEITIDDTDPTVLKLSFSGSIELDRGEPDQAKTFNKLTAGKVAHLHLVTYVKSGPNLVHRRDSEGNVDAIVASKSVVVTDIRLDD